MRRLFVAIRCGKQTSPTLRLWAWVVLPAAVNIVTLVYSLPKR